MARLGIAAIHGIGWLRKQRPEDSAARVFSDRLRKGLIDRLGAETVAQDIAWRENFWNDIVQEGQDAFARRLAPLRIGWLRGFVVNGLGDAAGYAPARDPGSTYQRIHARVDAVLAELERDTDGGPLILIAHSMGGHIPSNFIWDRLKAPPPQSTPFGRFQTLAALVTFGCNIPIFVFHKQADRPIAPPASRHRQSPWWRNYYAPADPLGYPLAATGPGYAALAAGPQPGLVDVPVWPGWPVVQSHTALSHLAYDRSAQVLDPLAGVVRTALERV